MIEDVQDLAQLTASAQLKMTDDSFSVRELVASVSSMFEMQAEAKGIKLLTEVCDLTPTKISADSKRLKQLLINLVGNAIKFTTRGHVKIKIAIPDEVLSSSSMPTKDQAKLRLFIEVSDTGVGMK